MKLNEYLPSFLRMRQLRQLNSVDFNNDQKLIPVSVSLKTIPSRFHCVDKTILSLLSQEQPPEHIYLWINRNFKNQLPKRLTKLADQTFTIMFTDYESSHYKLVPMLEKFTDRTVVTCDDDVMYPKGWLSSLWETHMQYPSDIISHVARKIRFDDGTLEFFPYSSWSSVRKRCFSHPNVLPIGVGGVLYPKNIMPALTTDRSVFMQLAPKADDLWFKAVAFAHGIQARTSQSEEQSPLPIPFSQKISLKKHNVREDGNRAQWVALHKYFGFKFKDGVLVNPND